MTTVAKRSFWLASAAGAALLAAGVWSSAQVQIGTNRLVAQDGKDATMGKDSTQAVYVNESSTAVDKLVSAQKMERLKEWAKAADYYQEVVQKYNDKVVPTGVDSEDVISQYGSIKEKVREALSKWPKEGVDAYKAQYESVADALLKNAPADDLNALHQVFDTYFITDAGKRAGLRLIAQSMEEGEFESAARIGNELLKWHPGLGDDRPAIAFETGLAAHYGGQEDLAQSMLQMLKTQFPAARGIVRGTDQSLVDALTHELSLATTSAQVTGPDSWKLSIGGDPSRSQISTAEGRPQARLYQVDLAQPRSSGNRNINPAIEEQMQRRAEAMDTDPGVIPAVDRGELYFQDGRRVYAVNLDSGIALPGWSQSYPGTGQYVLPDVNGAIQTRQMCVTLTDHDVLAIMGENQQNMQAMMLQQPSQPNDQFGPRLVCLSRQTGKPRWVIRLSELPQAAQDLRAAEMIGSPLVVGSNVLLLARSSSQVGFVNCYCICFDMETGKFRWKSYIASANVNPNAFFGMPGMYGGSEETQFSHPAYADGRVYVQTNVGAVAAVDAFDGSIAWLHLYPSNTASATANPMMNPFFQRPAQDQKPFAGNPLIVSKGKVFAIPSDSDNLLIYDASNGAEIKRINLKDLGESDDLARDMQSPLSFNTLMAVDGNSVILAGRHEQFGQVCSIDWSKYSDKDAAVQWASAPMVGGLVGRGFVTADSVFVPTGNQLYRIDRAGGIIRDSYPTADRHWDADAGEGPGNVVVTTDRVIIAGAERVEVYADLSAARHKLDAAIAAAPTDPNPRMEYAEVMFVSGLYDQASTRLDEAMELLGGQDHLAAGAARDRFFADAMTFARKTAASQKPDGTMVNHFFDRAAISANNPIQFVDYYLTRGAYEDSLCHGNTAQSAEPATKAVALYQKVLTDPNLRDVQRIDEKGHNTDAGALAAVAIDRIITDIDPQAYAPFNQQAADALAKVTADKGDGQAFQEVAKTYPNSASAPKALLLAADAYEAGGQHTSAIQVLRQMYFERKNDQFAPQLLEGMARNYLERTDHSTSDRLSAAAASLSRAVAVAPDATLERPLTLPNGKTIENQTLSQALTAIRQERGEESARLLPDFRLPTPVNQNGVKWPQPFAEPGPADVIPDTRALLMPAADLGRPDRVVTQDTHGQLCIYPAMQPDPLVRVDVGSIGLSTSAWSGNTLLAWGPQAILSVKDKSDKVGWAMQVADLPEVHVDTGDDTANEDEGAAKSDFAFRGNRLRANLQFQAQQGAVQNIVIKGGGNAVGVIVNGGGAPVGQFPNETIVKVRPVGDRIVCMTNVGRIFAIDTSTGKFIWQDRPGMGNGSSYVANEDFTVVRSIDNTGVRLTCFDTYSGRRLGEKAFSPNGTSPMSMALAADGTLVYSMGDHIAFKDLFKPWGDQPDKQSPALPGQAAIAFDNFGAPQEGQLVISEGRILAVWNDAPLNNQPEAGAVIVRVFSLDTAKPEVLHFASAQGAGELPVQLAAGKSINDVKLIANGSRVYIIGGSLGISSYDLDHPGSGWTPMPGIIPQDVAVTHTFIGQDHILLLTQPPGANQWALLHPQGPGMGVRMGNGAIIRRNHQVLAQMAHAQGGPTLGIYAFARYSSEAGSDVESGRIDYTPAAQPSCAINDLTGVQAAQGVNGGLCYLTGDDKLHLLRGAAQSEPASETK